MPVFFNKQEESFEQDLARTASFGFFFGRPLGRSTPSDGVDPLDKRQQRIHAKIQAMLAEELRKDGAAAPDVEKHFEVVPRDTWAGAFASQGMKNPTPRVRMIDGFNEGWIEFEGGASGSRKGAVELKTALRNLMAGQVS
jgi:hypothetical protein